MLSETLRTVVSLDDEMDCERIRWRGGAELQCGILDVDLDVLVPGMLCSVFARNSRGRCAESWTEHRHRCYSRSILELKR